jgi:hypothetical protein
VTSQKFEEMIRLVKSLPREDVEILARVFEDYDKELAARSVGQPWEEVGRAIYKETVPPSILLCGG